MFYHFLVVNKLINISLISRTKTKVLRARAKPQLSSSIKDEIVYGNYGLVLSFIELYSVEFYDLLAGK